MNVPWYLQPAFMPVHSQDLILWLNSSSWDGTTWRNLAPSYSNVNHGMLMNGVAIGDLIHPSGVFGAPRKFDGTDDHVNCGNDSSFDITGAITIEVSVKLVSNTDWKSIVSTDDSAGGYALQRSADSKHYHVARIFLRTAEGSNVLWRYSTKTIDDNSFHHITATYDGSGENGLHMYVDGVLDDGDVSGLGSGNIVTSNLDVIIGNGPYYNTQWFNGSTDSVKIYNHVLSASDAVHNHTHSPIYYMQHGIDPLSLLSQTPQEAAHLVA